MRPQKTIPLDRPARAFIDLLADIFVRHFTVPAEGKPFETFVVQVFREEGINVSEQALRTYLQLRERP